MTKDQFYSGKIVVEVEWWLSESHLPELAWARLRVFDDLTADALFEGSHTIYGFESKTFAGYLLSEDEYRRLLNLDEDDEAEYGVELKTITPPNWADESELSFEYHGSY